MRKSMMKLMDDLKTPIRTILKIDNRGRVRFAAQGCRFEVTKNGMHVYNRSTFLGEPSEFPAYLNVNRLINKTLKLIAEAVNLVDM